MRGFTFVAAATVLIAFGEGVSADTRTSAYEVIVNSSNPVNAMSRDFLADAFLKKITSWPRGETIRPVDLPPNSPVRKRFTEEVLHRSVAEVKGYWQQRIFSGRDVPPPELDTDDDVVTYVNKYTGAVGYVSAGANLNGAKILGVQ
jgi:ABC-type phosphate transport system substrate-binding protein